MHCILGMMMKMSSFLMLLLLYLVSFYLRWCRGEPVVAKASFVFGDSLVDGGNNNYIFSLSKADEPLNGIDFPGGLPTGRFCNGRTVPDIVGEKFGLPFAPPFLAPTTQGNAILYGVNYGSGGAGILDETGVLFIGRISLWKQIEYFRNTTMQLRRMMGNEEANSFLADSIVSLTIGSNDYLNNYLSPAPLTSDATLSPQHFQDRLISTFTQQLMALYEAGARKIIVSAIGPIGCIPYQLTFNLRVDGSCAQHPNILVSNFNSALKILVMELNEKLPELKMVYANSYNIVLDLITNYTSHGFENANVACCGVGGPYRGILPCGRYVSACQKRSKFFFWDPYHPSDAANQMVADKLVDGSTDDVYPYNIRQLFA